MVLSAHLTDEVRKTYEELGVEAIFEVPFGITQRLTDSFLSFWPGGPLAPGKQR